MASYKLTVGDIAGIQLSVDSVTTKFNGKDFYVTMQSLTYTKKIFAPSEIHTMLSVKAKDSSTTSFPKLSELQSSFSKKRVTLKNGDTSVCENFFVYRMKPSRDKISSASATINVELEIYSLDKLLTIDKYCNAYTARKLGGEIFMGELWKFRLGTQTVEGDVNLQILNYSSKEKGETIEVRQPYLVQYNESFYDFLARSAARCGEMLYFEGGKLHLGMPASLTTATEDQITVADSVDYDDCIGNVLTVTDRHYDFMKRGEKNDNRYVDSAFQLLGAYDNEKKENPTQERKEDTNTNKQVTKVTTTKTTYFKKGTETEVVQTSLYTESDVDPEKQLAGQPKSEVSTLTFTDNNNKELLKVTKTVTYTYEKGSDGNYKKENKKFVFSTKTEQTVTGDTFPGIYNQPEPDDALFEELKKDGYTNPGSEIFDARTFFFSNFFLKRLSDTNLFDMMVNLAADIVSQSVEGAVASASKNKANNENNLTLNSKDNPDQVKDDNYSLFSTLKDVMAEDSKLTVNKSGDVVSLLVSAFYSKIRSASRKVSETLVRLNYGVTDKGMHLGDVLKVGSGKEDFYIVTKVELNVEGNYVVEAMPSYYLASAATTDGKSYTVSSFIPCPPLLPEIPAVRKSEPQVAFVEQNLDPNKLGRVRVKYPWQTTDSDCSPWVRMATPFATNGGGVTFMPESGDEVLLNYEDGNIERPYIVGSLQSKYVTDHWGGLPDRVIQSKNGHTIKFKDDDGLDFFTGLLPAADFIKGLIPISDSVIGLQNVNDLGGGIEITDRYGLYKIGLSSSGRSVSIESSMGNVDINAFTGISISAPNGNIEIKGKNVSIAASNRLTLESGSAVSDRFYTPSWGIVKNLADKTIGNLIDFPLLRTVLEVFIRPVDGTLKVKSNTYVLIEAGKGSAQVPRDDYNKPDVGTGLDNMFDTSEPTSLGSLKSYFSIINSKATTLCDSIKAAFETAKTEYDAYVAVPFYKKLSKRRVDGNDDICKYILGKISTNPFNINDIVKEDDFGFDGIDEFKYQILEKDNDQYKEPDYKAPAKTKEEEDDKEHGEEKYKSRCEAHKKDWKDKLDNDKDVKMKRRTAIVDQARKFGTELKKLFDATEAWSRFDLDANDQSPVYFPDALKDTIRALDVFGKFIKNSNKGEVDWTAAFATNYAKEKVKLHRMIVYELLNATKDSCTDLYSFKKAQKPTDFGDDSQWNNFAKSIEEPEEDPISLKKAGKAVAGYFSGLVGSKSPWADTFVSRHRWKVPEKGRILLSDQPGRTLHFDSDELTVDDNVGQMTRAHIIELRREVNTVK